MFSSILRAGAAAAGLESQRTTTATREQQIAKLAVEVCQRMTTAERESKDQNETCLGLYGNFFLSILGLAEAAARLTIHFIIVLLFFLGYYIILCLSCGKAESGIAMRHQMSRVSLYSGLVAATLGNILMPWRPTLYLFHTPSSLSRPHVPNMQHEKGVPSSLDIENCMIDACCCCCNMCGCKRGQCLCCGTVAESILPPYKMAQSALFVVGCCTGCGCYQCTGEPALTNRINELNTEVEQESRDATSAFYQRLYNVPSWEVLVSSRFGGSAVVQGQVQQPPVQQYMQQNMVPPAQVNYSQTPVVVAQPVYSSSK
mmetsp:Transcript_4485/g.8349  ORF Transcript_4485/g.8349 Transcript_4485/m.8349 type:complete len:315 (-) Transcript_4485:1317-2261(-)